MGQPEMATLRKGMPRCWGRVFRFAPAGLATKPGLGDRLHEVNPHNAGILRRGSLGGEVTKEEPECGEGHGKD